MNMKLLTLVTAFSALTAQARQIVMKNGVKVYKDEYVVEMNHNEFSKLGISTSAVRRLAPNTYLIKVKEGDVSTLSTKVTNIEPNYVYSAIMGSKKPTPPPAPTPTPTPTPPIEPKNPNDPKFGDLYGIKKIQAPEAWNTTTGSMGVKVAIVDTGVDHTHPDLKANLMSKGFNAITGAQDAMDDNGHGTHCAGTIGAVGNNGTGVVGVNWKVSMVGVKFLDKDGSGALSDAIAAIDFAVSQKVDVISASWGGAGKSSTLQNAIKRACDAGISFIAAAGNENSNNDSYPTYPASYDLPCVVAVAATDSSDKLASFSNYGQTVDIAAPGVGILSTVPTCALVDPAEICSADGYRAISGTSMATPHVSGAFALLKAVKPGKTTAEYLKLLQTTADPVDTTKKLGGGRINLYRAMLN